MTFDSFLIIDNNNQQHVVKFNIHKQKDPYYKHPRKIIIKQGNKYDRLGYGGQYHAVYIDKNFKYNQDELIQSLRLGYKPWSKYKKRYDLKKKATKYADLQSKRLGYGRPDYTNSPIPVVSKTTLKNLKRELSKFGSYSIKLVFRDYWETGEHTFFTFTSHSKEIDTHLYFYNTQTKEKVRLDEFISISRMTGGGMPECSLNDFGTKFRYTGDMLSDYDIGLRDNKEFDFGLGFGSRIGETTLVFCKPI